MRKTNAALAVAATSAVGVTAIAQAVDVAQSLTVRTTGSKGTKAKPRPITLNVTTRTSARDGMSDGTYAITRAVLHLDRNLKFETARFPTCAAPVVSDDAAKCPEGSKVGAGRASAVIGPGGAIEVTPSVAAYNGPKGTLLLKLSVKEGENASGGVIVAKFRRDTGRFGRKLDVTVPPELQEQFGLFVTLTKLQVGLGATHERRPYVRSTGCTRGRYRFSGDFTFTDGTKVTGVRATSSC